MIIKLGELKKEDLFFIGKTKYKALYVGNRNYNNICCMNIKNMERKWFDIETKVEVK